MTNLNLQSYSTRKMYGIRCYEHVSDDISVHYTYRVYSHASSAYRAIKSLVTNTDNCSFDVEKIDADVFCLVTSEKTVIEYGHDDDKVECIDFIKRNISLICNNLNLITTNHDIHDDIKKSLVSGEDEVRIEIAKIPKSFLIDSIYFWIKPSYKNSMYRFGIGIHTRDCEKVKSPGSTTITIGHCDPMSYMSRFIHDMDFKVNTLALLEIMVIQSMYH